MRVSIIVNNFNYARFLGAAIDSALGQSHADTEVVVVDDGSTDASRDVISGYGDRVTPVLKQNGGQASAFNAGFGAAVGNLVIFLDADDVLYPTAAASAADLLEDDGVAKVHWPLDVIDESGQRTGEVVPRHALPHGDCKHTVIEGGPSSCPGSPTSGNAWTRAFLKRVLPMPEGSSYYRLGGDEYLSNLAPAFGELRTIAAPQGCYRLHGHNRYSGKTFEEKLRFELSGFDEQCAVMARCFRGLGYDVDVERWREQSWFHRLDRSITEIAAAIPDGSPLVLIDDQTWGASSLAGHPCIPFLERDGQSWGAPTNDASAIDELRRLRRQRDVDFVAIAWPAFWWTTFYPAFHHHLRSHATGVLENDRMILFDLRPERT